MLFPCFQIESKRKGSDDDHIPRVYGCATMWHESQEEIVEMLKSIFRIDFFSFPRYIFFIISTNVTKKGQHLQTFLAIKKSKNFGSKRFPYNLS